MLTALERRFGQGAVTYVSVGPASNFRARRWWHPFRGAPAPGAVQPVEAYAPLANLKASRRVWRERHQTRRALWASADLRARAIVRGCDCWPVVREELAGIALLQWPWSARAMDEAAAALDACRPRVVVTYAEAGGWGRAIVLESRRRGIPTAGLQHGFIYRHWLNYLHEPDEIAADVEQPEDRGFPAPTLTLLFDAYAARHLAEHGRFPADSLAVTGSPRLDALASEVARLTPAEIDQARAAAGAGARTLVLVTTKHREAHGVLAPLLDAAAALPDVHVAIKAHPAETPGGVRGSPGRPPTRHRPARGDAARAAPPREPGRRHRQLDRRARRRRARHPGARHRAAEQPEPLRRGRHHVGRRRNDRHDPACPQANPV